MTKQAKIEKCPKCGSTDWCQFDEEGDTGKSCDVCGHEWDRRLPTSREIAESEVDEQLIEQNN